MSAGRFTTSYPAAAQLALLLQAERAALEELFAMTEVERLPVTKPTSDGRFVSRLGSKRVLWRREPSQRLPEILSIVDRSFAQA